jgi:hypothetical protein
MSFLSGTQTELFYSNATASTNLATFTTEDNLQKTYPPVIIPAGFFLNQGATGKAIKVHALGQLGCTTGSPTFLWSIRLLTSTTWSAGGILLGATAASASSASAQTLAPWVLDVDVSLRTLSIGGASTVVTMGTVDAPLGLVSPGTITIPANNVSPVVSTLDNSTTYYLFVSCACGTSNSLNLINMQILKVYGEN